MTLVFALLVASMFFPTRVTAVIAIFETQKDLGLLNIPRRADLPLCHVVPGDLGLRHARHVPDGAARDLSMRRASTAPVAVRMLIGIMLPMVKNGIVVVIIINFVTAWGEYLLARR